MLARRSWLCIACNQQITAPADGLAVRCFRVLKREVKGRQQDPGLPQDIEVSSIHLCPQVHGFAG